MSMSSAAAQPANRSSEPSMEEILASIRKIIADDQKALEAKSEPPVSAAPAPAAAEEEDEDILDLELATESPPEPPRVVAPQPVAPPAPLAAAFPPPRAPEVEPARLISDQAAGATSKAFQSLANAVFTQNARTMDEVVADMLRPMLKSWLDENLPMLVERLVKAEIERVARGGR